MPQSTPTRRTLLAATAGLAGVVGLAGCSTVERFAARDDRAALRKAVGDVPVVPRGIRVTPTHRRAARDRLDDALADALSLLGDTAVQAEMDQGLEADLRSLTDRRDRIAAETDDREAVEEFRLVTVEAVAHAATLRVRLGGLTPDAAQTDYAALSEDLGAADERLRYDRGSVDQAVVQLAAAEDRRRHARRIVEVVRDDLDDVKYRGIEAARDAGDPDEGYVWPLRSAATGLVRARLALDDATRLATALPRTRDHADAMTAAYDAVHTAVADGLADERPMDRWYDVGMADVAFAGSTADLLGLAAEANAAGRLATAVRRTLLAATVLPAQVDLTDRLPEMAAEELAVADVAVLGESAHATFRGAVANASSVLELSLLYDVCRALEGGDDAARRVMEGSDAPLPWLRRASLRYGFVAAAAGAVPGAVRRFEGAATG